MGEIADKPINFVQSIETRKLIDRMMTMACGDVLEYSEIEEITGRKLNRVRGSLGSARATLLKTDRMVFGTITRVGIKRLADSEIVDSSASSEKRIGRISRKELKRLACAEYSSLPSDKKISHNARMTIFAMTSELSSSSAARKIESAVRDSGSAIPSAKAAILALDGIA